MQIVYTPEEARDRANAIQAAARQEKRPLTSGEETELKRILDALESFIASQEQQTNPNPVAIQAAGSAGRKIDSALPGSPQGLVSLPSGPVFQEPNGARIQAYRHGERLTPQGATAPGEVGETIRCMLLGKDTMPKGVVKNAAGADGANLTYSIPSYLSSSLIDMARSRSVCLQAGASTVPLQGGNLTLMTVTSDPEMQWRGGVANAWNPFQVSQPSFDRIQLTLKDVGCLVGLSLSLLEDSSNAAAMLEAIMTAAMANAIDRAILAGAGGLEPIGILNASSGVTEIANVGAITSYARHIEAVKRVLDANFQGEITNLAWLSSPTVRAAFQSLVSSATDQLIEPPSWIRSLRSYTTTALNQANSPAEFADVIGDMSTIVVGVRPSGVLVDMQSSGLAVDASNNSYNATASISYLLRVFFRLDVACTRPSWLVKLTGITG